MLFRSHRSNGRLPGPMAPPSPRADAHAAHGERWETSPARSARYGRCATEPGRSPRQPPKRCSRFRNQGRRCGNPMSSFSTRDGNMIVSSSRDAPASDHLEHDPEKWKPVFPWLTNAERVCAEIMFKQRGDHDAIPSNRIMIQRRAGCARARSNEAADGKKARSRGPGSESS